MTIDYVLTAFSLTMFGKGATAHIKALPIEEARSLVGKDTKILAPRVSHERFAKLQIPEATGGFTRYVELSPGVNVIHLHYRGPQLAEDGHLPSGGAVTAYLIEVEDYHEPDEA
jgi:hypothetical protein